MKLCIDEKRVVIKLVQNIPLFAFFLYKQKLHGSIYVKFTIFQNHVT